MTLPTILYDNRLADAVPLASSTAPGFEVANLLDWYTFTYWRPATLPADVTVDSGTAKASDYALLWGHDLGTQGATLEVRGSSDNFAGSNVLLASATPADDRPLALHYASQSFRYTRLGLTGAGGAPTIAIAAIGAKLDIPASLRPPFDPVGRRPMGRTSRSVTGNPLARAILWQEWKASLRFQYLSWDWLRAVWLPAWETHLKNTPFVFSWNRDLYPQELHLASTDDFRGPHQPGSIAELRFDLQGLAAP